MQGFFNITTAISLTVIAYIGIKYFNMSLDNKIDGILILLLFGTVYGMIEHASSKEVIEEMKIRAAYNQGKNEK